MLEFRSVLAFLMIALTASIAAAQAPKPGTKTAPPAAKPADKAAKAPTATTPPAATTPAATPPAATTPAATEPDPTDFNALFEKWKEVLKEIRKVKEDFNTAKPEEEAALQKKWNESIALGKTLLPKLREAGKKSYLESKVVDPQLPRFLLKLAQDAVETDDYEVAFDLSSSILAKLEADNSPQPKELYSVAGVSAFYINDYAAADKYLKLAQESGSLQGRGSELVSELKKYRGYWEQENELREKETKADDLPRVKLATTAGTMVIELFENQAPETVGNFVSLVESDFYNGLTFHRVLPHFMAQGGDPKGDGTGDANYKIYCETDKPDARRHFRGTLSMAHAGKDTGGSQFFICFTPQEGLDGKHTAFGRVIEGFDVLARIQRRDPQNPGGVEPTKIVKAEVLRKRDHKYLPRRVE